MLQIRLFGSVEVVGETGRIASADFPSRKAKQVCEVLALAGGRPVSKDQLLDTVWGVRLPRDPGATVEQAISTLRAALAGISPAATIVTERGHYRFDASVVEIDLVAFDELLEAADRTDGSERLELLRQAMELAADDLLRDERSAPWAEVERERHRRRIEQVAIEVARLSLAQDDAVTAHEAAERARTHSPIVFEEAYALDVVALVQLGRRHEARLLMRELERRLTDEEAGASSEWTTVLRPLLQSSNGGAAAGTTVRTILAKRRGRARALPMVGRDAELSSVVAAIGDALDGADGLVLVAGATGTGRTRFLHEVATAIDRPAQVISFPCLPSDADHPLLAAGRLLRVIARAARVRTMPPVVADVAVTFGQLVSVLDRLGPSVLLIDDLDRADAATLAVVSALAAPGGAPSMCLVATQRPTGRGRASLLEASARRSVRLAALSKPDVDAFGIDGLWAETGGHPATVAACLEAIRRDGVLSPAATAAVFGRVDELGELGRHVLNVASSQPQPFDLTEVARGSLVSREVVVDVVRRASEAGVLRTVGADRGAFSGDLTRRALVAAGAARRELR